MVGDLRAELLTDPEGLGYPVSDQGAADLLNSLATGRTRNRVSMTGDEVFANIANRAAWDGLTNNQKLEFLSLCARDIINPFGAANVELVKSIFGNSSATVSNLAAARVETVSRAVELEIRSPVREQQVRAART